MTMMKMARSNSTQAPEEAAPSSWLREFVNGEERAFNELVNHYSSLIHASALRRTNQPELAEEIVQTVFILLAKKANSLLSHPSLTGWIYQTTRLETLKAMRKEHRRNNKHQVFINDAVVVPEIPTEEVWEEALPFLDESLDQLSENEREIIFLRFFEGKKFREIAADKDTSVSACKMRLKRSLERLSRHLRKRDIILSASSLSAGLKAQLIATSPLQTSAILASQALSPVAALSHATLISNTLITMTVTKKLVVFGSLVASLAAIPMIQKAVEKVGDSDSLGVHQGSSSLSAGPASIKSTAGSSSEQRGRGSRLSKTQHIDYIALLEEASSAMNPGDMARVFLPILDLDAQEIWSLLEGVAATKGFDRVKPIVVESLIDIMITKGVEDHQQKIERLMASSLEFSQYELLMRNWAKTDPDAALEWFYHQQSIASTQGGGQFDKAEFDVFASIIGGIAEDDADRALILYQGQSDVEVRERMLRPLSEGIAQQAAQSEDLSFIYKLLEMESDENLKRLFANTTATRYSMLSKDLVGSIALVNSTSKIGESNGVIERMIQGAGHESFETRANLLRSNISDGEIRHTVARLIRGDGEIQIDRQAWLESAEDWTMQLSPGILKNKGHTWIAKSHLDDRNFQAAYEQAKLIDDDYDKVRQSLAQEWQAAEGLGAVPTELVQFLSE